MTTGFVWHERMMWHDAGPSVAVLPSRGQYQPGIHFENAETKRRLKNLMDGYELTSHLTPLPFTPAGLDAIHAVHDATYVDRVRQLSAGNGGDAGEFALVGPGTYEIALLAAGGAMAALAAVAAGEVRNAYALCRPPGHHAEPAMGRGFCIFNNVAIAIHHVRKTHSIRRIAVLDWDVHHGNGTESAFLTDSETLVVSIHQDGLYPMGRGGTDAVGEGTGAGFNINVPLPPGSGGGAYLHALDEIVIPAFDVFDPDILIVSSGFDACAMDPLSAMMLSSNHYRAMTERLLRWSDRQIDGRLCFVHEGGYSAEYVPFCGLAVVEALAGKSTDCIDPFAPMIDAMPGQALQPHQAAAIESARAAAPLLRNL
jgi:acetoin utilization deacetylase AcuC-like enzyme